MAKTAKNGTANTKNVKNIKKEEKTVKNIKNMTKAELITLLEQKDEQIITLKNSLELMTQQYEALQQALVAVKTVTKAFVAGMNDIYKAQVVKNATAEPERVEEEVKSAEKTVNVDKVDKVEKPEPAKAAPRKPNTGKGKGNGKVDKDVKTTGKGKADKDVKATGKVANKITEDNTTKKWMTKEEYKAQFTPEQIEEYKQKKRVKNYVAKQMREEARINGYWNKEEYREVFNERVNAILNGEVKM